MRKVVREPSTAPPDQVWTLVARPENWSRWAPHVRGAWGLGRPEVEEGRLGAARLLGVLPVPARITEVQPGRRWCWTVGPVRIVHEVEPADGGSIVSMIVAGPGPVVLAYAPVVAVMNRRLARAAERLASGPGHLP